jgi:hypothetical protein
MAEQDSVQAKLEQLQAQFERQRQKLLADHVVESERLLAEAIARANNEELNDLWSNFLQARQLQREGKAAPQQPVVEKPVVQRTRAANGLSRPMRKGATMAVMKNNGRLRVQIGLSPDIYEKAGWQEGERVFFQFGAPDQRQLLRLQRTKSERGSYLSKNGFVLRANTRDWPTDAKFTHTVPTTNVECTVVEQEIHITLPDWFYKTPDEQPKSSMVPSGPQNDQVTNA